MLFHLGVLYFFASSLKLHVIKLPGFVVVLCGHCFEGSPNSPGCVALISPGCVQGARMMYTLDQKTQDRALGLATNLSSDVQGRTLEVSACTLYYWGLTAVLNKNHTSGLAS